MRDKKSWPGLTTGILGPGSQSGSLHFSQRVDRKCFLIISRWQPRCSNNQTPRVPGVDQSGTLRHTKKTGTLPRPRWPTPFGTFRTARRVSGSHWTPVPTRPTAPILWITHFHLSHPKLNPRKPRERVVKQVPMYVPTEQRYTILLLWDSYGGGGNRYLLPTQLLTCVCTGR